MDNNNDGMLQTKYLKMITILLYGVAGIALSYLFFKYLFVWLLPFILAWAIAMFIDPFVVWLTQKLRLPRKLSSLICLIITVAVFGLVIYVAAGKISHELMALVRDRSIVQNGSNGIYEQLHKVLSELLQRLSFAGNISETATQILDNIVASLSGLSATVLAALTGMAAKIPSLLLLILVTIISAYFISSDFDRIKKFIAIQIPVKFRPWLSDLQRYLIQTVFKFVKAYLFIMMITFVELMIGFSILKVEYAITLAAITAVVDILPVLGTGTVLVPWALISLISGDPYRAIGIIVIYAIITVIRQVLEPKIIGHNVGLYPLATLVSIYLGFKAFGVGGMFLFPFLVILAKYLHDSGKIKLYNNLPKPDKPSK